jgi:OmpA-OmpF porin, OOP family
MFRYLSKAICFIAIGALMMGCAAVQAPSTLPPFQPQQFPEGQYQKKADNFIILLDASASMADKHNGKVKLDIARGVVNGMNQTIPDLGFTAGFRSFGQGKCLPGNTSSLIFGMAKHCKKSMGKALERVTCAGGNTPMEVGIDASAKDFSAVSGKIALIIVSDGIVIDNMPVMAAENIKKQYGERICIYTVLVGNHPGGKATMKKIADVGTCGFTVNADEISSSQGMADFVRKVFLKKAPRKVEPPPPPAAAPAPAKPRDSDNDGIYDDMDKCPGTPRSARVDRNGCWILPTVLFDTAKWNIDSFYNLQLDEVSAVLKRNPALRMEIQGHTDSRGSVKYNN